jgi:uncharacterized protein YkwD
VITRARQSGLALVIAMAVSPGLVVAVPTTAAADSRTPADQALALVNQQRIKAGCAALHTVAQLQRPAAQQSHDQAAQDKLGHRGTNGSTSRDRIGRLGYSQWAENVAQFPNPQQAVHFWSTSSAHRTSMLNCAFTDTGLAVARSPSGRLYWTQTFGG